MIALEPFFQQQLERTVDVEPVSIGGKTYYRCSVKNVVFLDSPDSSLPVTIVTAGKTRYRAKEDFAHRVKGKTARTYGPGVHREVLIPKNLAV